MPSAQRALTTASVALVLTCAVWTQSPQGVTPLTIEFRATDRNRQPVVDLTPADIRLTIDGRERPVRALELRGSAGALPAPFASNSSGDPGRAVVLVVDEESILPVTIDLVRQALTTVVSMLGPADRVGLVSLHRNGSTLAPTNRRDILDKAIGAVQARAFSRENAVDLACRTRLALQRLTNFFGTLQRGPATTVLVLSAALAVPRAAPVFTVGVESGCILQPVDFDDYREAVQRTAAQVYGLHVVDPGVPEDTGKAAGLETLAGSVDGAFERLAPEPSEQLRRIVAESAPYYVASFDVDAPARRGITHAIDLQVRRDGVKTRVRREATIAASDAAISRTPRDMLRVATAFRDLPLRAAAYPSRGSDAATMKIVVAFEPEGPATLSSALVGLFNAQGRLVTQWEPERADLANRPVIAGLVAPAGIYRMRVAAIDASGRSGTVDDEVRVELAAAGPVQLSAPVLGIPGAGSFAPRLQFDAADAAAVVYVEAYGVAPCSRITAALELRSSAAGPVLANAPAEVTPIDQSIGCIVYGGFEIAALEPADYLVRAVVSVDGAPAGGVSRTLRKLLR